MYFTQYLRDFERLYPGHTSSLFNRWDTIKGVIISQLQKTSKIKGKVKDIGDQASIQLLPTLDAGKTIVFLFYLIFFH